MASITLENLNKTYPNGFVSVKNLSLHIEDGEFVTFFGPSGCGKSTILRMIGGMEDITSGEIYLGKDLLNDILPRDRSLAMAFQNYQLYSHLNVYDNIALGLRLRNLPRQIIDSRVKMAAHFFNITDILEKKIRVINEAQKQRVALGRGYQKNLNHISSSYKKGTQKSFTDLRVPFLFSAFQILINIPLRHSPVLCDSFHC